METANAFDMLILPILQTFAATFVAFPLLHGIRLTLGWCFDSPEAQSLAGRSR